MGIVKSTSIRTDLHKGDTVYKMYENKDPLANFMIEATPEQLRTLADRLEQKIRTGYTLPGQIITVQFSNGIQLFCRKENNTLSYIENAANEFGGASEVLAYKQEIESTV